MRNNQDEILGMMAIYAVLVGVAIIISGLIAILFL